MKTNHHKNLLTGAILVALLFQFNYARSQEEPSSVTRDLQLYSSGITPTNLRLSYASQISKCFHFMLSSRSLGYSYSEDMGSPDAFPTTSFRTFAGVSIGFQNRRRLNDRMQWFLGYELILGGGTNTVRILDPMPTRTNRRNTSYNLQTGFIVPFGVMAEIGKSFYGLLRVEPTLMLNFQNSLNVGRTTTFGTTGLLGPSQIKIGIQYRWDK